MTEKAPKLMFFDIDGTLIPLHGQIPGSAVDALKRAKEAGHRLFLCSGRSECLIQKELLDLGFDGIVSAAGATISYRGQRLRMLSMGDRVQKLVEILEDNQAFYTLQTPDASYGPMRSIEFEEKYEMQAFHILHEQIHEHPGKFRHAEKAVVFYSPVPHPQLATVLAPEFEVTANSLDPKNQYGCEITMTGVNKSSAMDWLGAYFGIPREDMIAFGDGPNDLDMIAYAGVGVAMGNAVDGVKAVADYITTSVTQDGIYNAMKHLLNWD